MRTGLLILVLTCGNHLRLAAQGELSQKQRWIVDQTMERLTENNEGGIDYSDLQTRLEYAMLNPINLNRADEKAAEMLFFLTYKQQQALLSHRKKYGAYLGIYELKAVDGLDVQTAQLLSAFVTVEETNAADHETPVEMLKKGRHELICTHGQELQKRKGYLAGADKGYAGSPFNESIRYRFAYTKRLCFGFAAEKDKGEQFGNTPVTFFDFNSFYFFYRGKGMVRSVALGDYQASFGNGLIFGSGLGIRKSAMVLNTINIYETLRPYRSLNEAGFLRGAAVTLGHRRFELSLFASAKRVDATLTLDSAGDAIAINSVALTGLHRTAAEIGRRNNSWQQTGGLNLCCNMPKMKAGMCWVGSTYNHPLSSQAKPYQLYDGVPDMLFNAGVYGNVYIRNVSLSGGFASSSNKAFAGYATLLVPLHPKADLVLLYRHYGVNYQGIQVNAFSEYGDCRNEQGMYVALQFKPYSNIQVGMYADVFKCAWLRYLTNAPSDGEEYMVNVQYNASKTMAFEARYKCELKARNVNDESVKLYYVEQRERQQLRLQFSYQLSKELSLKTRYEEALFDKPLQQRQTGGLFFQDVHLKLFKTKLGLAARLAWFDVQNYDARVYATESDVLYAYSIPQFNDKGWRFYILVHYKVNRTLELNLKYGRTAYGNITTIGSGLEQIDGSMLEELKIQLRMQW